MCLLYFLSYLIKQIADTKKSSNVVIKYFISNLE